MTSSPHWQNECGLQAGWYVIAKPGMQFEVRTTRVNRLLIGFPHEDAVSTQLLVDGVSTNEGKAFRDRDVWCSEVVQTGFVEAQVGNKYQSRDYRFRKRLRKFAFRKALGGEGAEDARGEIGCIKLVVSVGRCVWTDNGRLDSKNFQLKTREGVSEKQASKEGRSLRVGWEGESELIKAKVSKYRVEDDRVVPEAGITIFVREQTWMRCRRLVDDNGSPCTHAVFRTLLQQDSLSGLYGTSKLKHQPVICSKAEPAEVPEVEVIDLEDNDKVEQSTKDAGSSSHEKPPEVIDLT